ncbi:hypothetical protein V493_00779 [Pseudogymnoascus sp. VKM F-4281 (FW-2241)]|nr:hypothetical protein V493_00779 [Pseudogymnoascus sp. VKM F-4281 (FW-2241)]
MADFQEEPMAASDRERRAFIAEAKRINRQDLKVPKFGNGPTQDVQAFIDAVSWKHGITSTEFNGMSSEVNNELDECLVLYLFSKLEGEPARWWTNLAKESKTNFKKVAGLMIACYGRDEVCQKRSLCQRVAAELKSLHQRGRSLAEYVAEAKDIHTRISADQEQTLYDNFVNNLTDPGFANVLRALTSRDDLSFIEILDTVIDMQGPSYVEKKPAHEETVEESKNANRLMRTMANAFEKSQGQGQRGNMRNPARVPYQGPPGPFVQQSFSSPWEHQPQQNKFNAPTTSTQFQVQHYEQQTLPRPQQHALPAVPPQYQALQQVQHQQRTGIQGQWPSSSQQSQSRPQAPGGGGYCPGGGKPTAQCFKCTEYGHYAPDCPNPPASEEARNAARELSAQKRSAAIARGGGFNATQQPRAPMDAAPQFGQPRVTEVSAAQSAKTWAEHNAMTVAAAQLTHRDTVGLYDTDSDFSHTRNTTFSGSVSMFQAPPMPASVADVRHPLETYAAEKRKAPMAPQDARPQGQVRTGDTGTNVPSVQRKPRGKKNTGIEVLVGARPIRAIGDAAPYNVWDDLHAKRSQPNITFPQLINVSSTVRAQIAYGTTMQPREASSAGNDEDSQTLRYPPAPTVEEEVDDLPRPVAKARRRIHDGVLQNNATSTQLTTKFSSSIELINAQVAKQLDCVWHTDRSGWKMKTADGAVHPLDDYVLIPIRVASVEWVMKCFVIYRTTSYNILLGRGWLHQVRAVGDYSTNEYFIFSTDGLPRRVPKSGDVQPQVSIRAHFNHDKALQKRDSPMPYCDELAQQRLADLTDRLATSALLKATDPDYNFGKRLGLQQAGVAVARVPTQIRTTAKQSKENSVTGTESRSERRARERRERERDHRVRQENTTRDLWPEDRRNFKHLHRKMMLFEKARAAMRGSTAEFSKKSAVEEVQAHTHPPDPDTTYARRPNHQRRQAGRARDGIQGAPQKHSNGMPTHQSPHSRRGDRPYKHMGSMRQPQMAHTASIPLPVHKVSFIERRHRIAGDREELNKHPLYYMLAGEISAVALWTPEKEDHDTEAPSIMPELDPRTIPTPRAPGAKCEISHSQLHEKGHMLIHTFPVSHASMEQSTEEQQAFALEEMYNFPTTKRPAQFRRQMADASIGHIREWAALNPKLIGELITAQEDVDLMARCLFT